MRRLLSTLIAVGLIAAGARFANAAEGDTKSPEGRGKGARPDFQKKMLEKLDKNGDGQLSGDERDAAKAAFEARKGKPGEKGFGGKGFGGKGGPGGKGFGGKGGPGGKGGFGGKGPEEMMKKFDTNNDGKLDDTEKAAAKEAFQKRRDGQK